ncbi:hypothetical protein SDC9_160599 [bioreactor metagenome]|uniref:Uncharacterized protein n=1 Tax=bioreactor metagenome TaxID=1076179 RepID=A0A645FFV9_9ZZZZ
MTDRTAHAGRDPAGEQRPQLGGRHHQSVERRLVPDHLGRGGQHAGGGEARPRHRLGVTDGDVPAGLEEFPRGGQADDAGAHDDHGARPVSRARLGCRARPGPGDTLLDHEHSFPTAA